MRHHGAGLLRLTRNERLLADIKADFSGSAHLTEADKAVLEYAVKLTKSPASVSEIDVTRLHSHGFSDRAILEINLATAYMNFVNRIADGLGVEIEPALETFTR